MITPKIPITTPAIRLKYNFSLEISIDASIIEKKAVEELIIDASPPVVVFCP